MKQKMRKIMDYLLTIFCLFSLLIIMCLVISVFATLLKKGLPSLLQLNFYVLSTTAPELKGGLLNAIIGSLITMTIAIIVAIPIGVTTAIYLAEFSRGKKLRKIIRFVNDTLLSAPSIIIGLLCYLLFVAPTQNFSALAGSAALAVIAIPIIVRTSEDMLEIVPQALRESALALGASHVTTIFKIVLKSIYQGIFTGIIIAIARILGETAPLLFTTLNNQFLSYNPTKPIATLPIVIFEYAMSPYKNWQDLAWGGALLLTIVVMALSILSQILSKNQEHS